MLTSLQADDVFGVVYSRLTCTHVGGGSGSDGEMCGWTEVGRGARSGQVESVSSALRQHLAAVGRLRAAPHAHQHVALPRRAELHNMEQLLWLSHPKGKDRSVFEFGKICTSLGGFLKIDWW